MKQESVYERVRILQRRDVYLWLGLLLRVELVALCASQVGYSDGPNQDYVDRAQYTPIPRLRPRVQIQSVATVEGLSSESVHFSSSDGIPEKTVEERVNVIWASLPPHILVRPCTPMELFIDEHLSTKTRDFVYFRRHWIQEEGVYRITMAAAERGSFLWFMFGITQFFLSIKLMGEVEGWVTTLFGGGAAAAIMLAIVVFRMEQKELLLNPLKLNREVNEDAIKNQGKGVGFGVITWVVSLITLIFFVDF